MVPCIPADRERAVSPVIGVVLMVAIVVILASTAAVFIFGLTDNPDDAPQTRFTYEYNSSADKVTISVDGGQTIDSSNTKKLEVQIITDSDSERITWAADDGGKVDLTSDELKTGDSISIDDPTDSKTGDHTVDFHFDSGDTIKIIWESPKTQESEVIADETIDDDFDGTP
jgi:flagellin-like protein